MAETVDDKVSYFQAVTGITDTDLCTKILAAHNWDLQLAVSSITAPSYAPLPPAPVEADFVAPPLGSSVVEKALRPRRPERREREPPKTLARRRRASEIEKSTSIHHAPAMEREVVVSEDAAASASAPSSSFAETRVICRVCQKQFAQYTCPRCNARYCSLTCYKGHSVQCTELFMRENVTEELKQIQPEDDSKRQMLDILKRFHLEEEMESDGEDESMLSEELIQKAMSGEGIKLEDLSDDEIKRFRQALASGELSKMIEPWIPWWKNPSAKSISLSPDGRQLIKQISVEDTAVSDPMTGSESIISEIPEGPESPLPLLKQLTRADPSPLLSVHLVDILYSYCFTLRLYNGDWYSDPFGASTVALSMSKVMGEDAKPETVSEAVATCIEETCSPVYRHTGGFKFAIGLIDDIITILSLGGDVLVCALCDFRRLIQAGERMLKAEKVGKTERARSSHKLRGADRKLFFMTCWVHEQPNEAWPSLAHIVEVQKASLEELDSGSNLRKTGRKNNPQSKLLIEEV